MLTSPRVIVCRFHNGSFRSLVIFALVVLLVMSSLMLSMPSCTVLFSHSSWRNVSVYHILKMHLSGRPTHVTPLIRCEKVVKSSINMSHLNIDTIKYYEDVPSRMATLRPEDSWKKAFRPLLDKESKRSLLLLYAVLANALTERGVPHIVMHGTAMGAWRHHGITPWDDDIDVAVDVADWYQSREILSCLQGYTLDVGSNSKWAFFKTDGHMIHDSDKRWPFLDIFLYTHDDEYAWALNYVHLRKFVFRMEDLFPTQMVPFECLLVPAPHNLRKVLEHQYVHLDVCMSHYMDHKAGISDREVITRPCSELFDMYKMYFTNN